MNSEVAAYSVLGAGWPCNGWQGSSGIGSNRAEIKEIDVSNGSESGRNAAAISGRNMASLCHEATFEWTEIDTQRPIEYGRYVLVRKADFFQLSASH